MTEGAKEEGGGREGEGEGEREGGRGQGRELWVFRSFFNFIDRWMGGYGMNKEGFLIMLELCKAHFVVQYAAVFDLAAGFQARRLHV